MIVMEFYKTRDDGVDLYRTYSDRRMMIERDGYLYDEAIDPGDCGRLYNETETPITSTADEAEEAPEIPSPDSGEGEGPEASEWINQEENNEVVI